MARTCFALIYDAIKPLMSFGMDHSTRSHLVQREGRRRHFGGSPNHDTPNPCLTQQADFLGSRKNHSSFHSTVAQSQDGPRGCFSLSTSPGGPDSALQHLQNTLYSTDWLKDARKCGIIHTWSWSCPKTQGREAPGLSSWTKTSKTSTVTVTFWVATPKSCCKISFNPLELFDDYKDAPCKGKMDSESCSLPFWWTINIPLKSWFVHI